ncbi:MAG TPA: cytochrome c [Aequorivita sp.]|nr:cytochrome c [Aequorivita sp.]
MLSKQQARAFFLIGTVVTFLIFIGLTIYSFSDGNDQTNYENITPAVVRGKVIWEENNCMGCHTILGEGAYYAPELTKVVDRRGEGLIKAILMSPVPWEPNGRKMVAYGFTAEEADDVIAFFNWIGEIDLNGFDRIVSPLAKDKQLLNN